ncbi:MAG: Ger(x)C family spore germination protein [bacterium]|nr:Ger(x)C family spore germination protein [bacterium]
MKKYRIIIIIFFSLILSGCYNYRELNDLNIVSGVGIDKDGDNYLLTVQTINTSKQTSEDKTANPKIRTYNISAPTIQDAFRQLITLSAKRIYAEQNAVLIINEEIAKESFNEVLDIFFRDSESRKEYSVLISQNASSNEILETLTISETINAISIQKRLEKENKFLGYVNNVTFNDLMYTYLNDYTEIALPGITIIGNGKTGKNIENVESSNPDTQITLTTIGVFKKDKLVGWLNKEESLAYNFIKNKINNTVITNKCDTDNHISIEIINSKTKIDVDNKKNLIKINIKSNANINEITCHVNLEDPNVISNLEKDINDNIKNNIQNTIKKVIDEFNSDIFGFKDKLYKNNASYFKKYQNNDEILKQLEFDITVKVNLSEKGNIQGVINYEAKN